MDSAGAYDAALMPGPRGFLPVILPGFLLSATLSGGLRLGVSACGPPARAARAAAAVRPRHSLASLSGSESSAHARYGPGRPRIRLRLDISESESGLGLRVGPPQHHQYQLEVIFLV